MHSACLGCRQSFAMIRFSMALRNVNSRAVAANCLLVKFLPSSWSADFTSSAIAFRERSDDSSRFAGRRGRSPETFSSPPASAPPGLDVSAGGGPRPKKPLVWRTKNRRGSVDRSEKFVDVVKRLSNTKDEVYGTLDGWIAWDLEFPLIAVKKALKTLKEEGEWRRIIQVSKWMLDKGRGKTLATYQLLLEALDHEGRIDEAEVLWNKVLVDNMECIPRTMFAHVISMYDRYGKSKQLLKVFADMEELQVNPDAHTVDIVARTYTQYGYQEYGQALFAKYPSTNPALRKIKGKFAKVRSQPEEQKLDQSEEDKVDTLELKEGPRLVINDSERVA